MVLISVRGWVDSRAGRIMSMKNSKDTIGNRSRALPFCSAVPQPLRNRVTPFRREYPVLSLRLSNCFLRLLPRLSVASIPPFIFPSITCRRRQFLHKMTNPVGLPFTYFTYLLITYFTYSLTQSNTSSFLTWSVQLIFSILLQHHISKIECKKYWYKLYAVL
jgi:hypothetical protein